MPPELRVDALATLVARLVVKAQLQEAAENNRRLTYSSSVSGAWSPPSTGGLESGFPKGNTWRHSSQTMVSEMDGSKSSPPLNYEEKSPRLPEMQEKSSRFNSWRGSHKVSVPARWDEEGPVELPS